MTRPLWPYPLVATYRSTGDINREVNRATYSPTDIHAGTTICCGRRYDKRHASDLDRMRRVGDQDPQGTGIGVRGAAGFNAGHRITRSDVWFLMSVPYAASERVPVRNSTQFAEEP